MALRSLAAIEKLFRYRASRPTPQFPQASRALIFWSLGIASFLFLRHNLLHAEKIAGDTQAFNVSSSFQGSIFKYLIELIYRPISLVRTFPRASNMWSIGASLATLPASRLCLQSWSCRVFACFLMSSLSEARSPISSIQQRVDGPNCRFVTRHRGIPCILFNFSFHRSAFFLRGQLIH